MRAAGIEQRYDKLFKIMLLGDASSDKDALLGLYVDGERPAPRIAHDFGIDVRIKMISLQGQVLELQIWTLTFVGHYRLLSLNVTNAIINETHAIVMFYNSALRSSLDACAEILDVCTLSRSQSCRGEVPIFLVRNNVEGAAADTFEIPDHEGAAFAAEHGLRFFALDPDTNLDTLFELGVARQCLVESSYHLPPVPFLWSADAHSRCPPGMRRAIVSVLLCAEKKRRLLEGGTVSCVTEDREFEVLLRSKLDQGRISKAEFGHIIGVQVRHKLVNRANGIDTGGGRKVGPDALPAMARVDSEAWQLIFRFLDPNDWPVESKKREKAADDEEVKRSCSIC